MADPAGHHPTEVACPVCKRKQYVGCRTRHRNWQAPHPERVAEWERLTGKTYRGLTYTEDESER